MAGEATVTRNAQGQRIDPTTGQRLNEDGTPLEAPGTPAGEQVYRDGIPIRALGTQVNASDVERLSEETDYETDQIRRMQMRRAEAERLAAQAREASQRRNAAALEQQRSALDAQVAGRSTPQAVAAGLDPNRARTVASGQGVIDRSFLGNAQEQELAGQRALIAQLQAAAEGRGPSLVQTQLRQATDRNMAQLMAAQATARGGPGAAAQQRALQSNLAAVNQGAAMQSAELQAQEQLAARQQLAGALAQARGQSIDVRGQEAQMASLQAQIDLARAQGNVGEFNRLLAMQAQLQQQANLLNPQLQLQAERQRDEVRQRLLAMGYSADEADRQANMAAQGIINQGAFNIMGIDTAEYQQDEAGEPNGAAIAAGLGSAGVAALGDMLRGGNNNSDIRMKTDVRPVEGDPEVAAIHGDAGRPASGWLGLSPPPKVEPAMPTPGSPTQRDEQDRPFGWRDALGIAGAFMGGFGKGMMSDEDQKRSVRTASTSTSAPARAWNVDAELEFLRSPLMRAMRNAHVGDDNMSSAWVETSSTGARRWMTESRGSEPADIARSERLRTSLPGLRPTATSTVSDRRQKEVDATTPVDRFLDALTAYTFRYKHPERHGDGRRLGIMAQDLERTELGEGLVRETPEGKVVDGAGLASAAMASAIELHRKQRALERQIETLRGRGGKKRDA